MKGISQLENNQVNISHQLVYTFRGGPFQSQGEVLIFYQGEKIFSVYIGGEFLFKIRKARIFINQHFNGSIF